MITQPFHGDKDLSYELGQILINKVLAVLEDEKVVQEIIEESERDKMNEHFHKSLKKHPKFLKESIEQQIERRIIIACRKAEVDYKQYKKALGWSYRGYNVVLQRDIDEIYINNFNEE